MQVPSLGWEVLLQEDTATHSSILAWRIPWTEKPSGLQFTGSQSQTRLRWLSTHIHMKVKVLVTQLCPTLCNPTDSSLLGSSVCGIL